MRTNLGDQQQHSWALFGGVISIFILPCFPTVLVADTDRYSDGNRFRLPIELTDKPTLSRVPPSASKVRTACTQGAMAPRQVSDQYQIILGI